MKENQLERKDFKRIDLEPGKCYYELKSNLLEIDLEPCAGGFCVAVYDRLPSQNLFFPKKCTNHEGYDQSYNAFIGERREDTWNKALEIANKFLTDYNLITS